MISTNPHERFSALLSLDPKNTCRFASMVGDTNPLHHDTDYATATRFGRFARKWPANDGASLGTNRVAFFQAWRDARP